MRSDSRKRSNRLCKSGSWIVIPTFTLRLTDNNSNTTTTYFNDILNSVFVVRFPARGLCRKHGEPEVCCHFPWASFTAFQHERTSRLSKMRSAEPFIANIQTYTHNKLVKRHKSKRKNQTQQSCLWSLHFAPSAVYIQAWAVVPIFLTT